MQYNELLKVFGEKLGGGMDLTPDAAGAVMLDVDGMPLTILNLEEVDLVALVGVVGEPPPEERMERLYRVLLEANHNFAGTAGSTLSINQETGKVSLCRVLPLALTDGDTFFGEVERFVNMLETWRKLVADYRAADSSPETPPSPSAEPRETDLGTGFGSGFMRV